MICLLTVFKGWVGFQADKVTRLGSSPGLGTRVAQLLKSKQQLINTSARQVVAQQTFAISKKLNDESLNMIIETLNEIHVQLSEQILIWLQTKI